MTDNIPYALPDGTVISRAEYVTHQREAERSRIVSELRRHPSQVTDDDDEPSEEATEAAIEALAALSPGTASNSDDSDHVGALTADSERWDEISYPSADS